MRFSATALIPAVAVCLAAGLAAAGLLAISRQPAGAEETARKTAAKAAPAAAPTWQPTSHAELYRKLGKPVPAAVVFQIVPLATALEQLSAASGVDIELVPSGNQNAENAKFLRRPRGAFAESREPLSLETAIQLVTSFWGEFALSLEPRGVRIVERSQVGDEYVLETHDLAAISEYTTHLRARLIEQLRRDVAPDDWKQPDGPWIVPGRSVFAIDVYARPAVQKQIEAYWRREYVDKYRADPAYTGPQRETTYRKRTPEAIAAKTRELRAAYPLVSLAGRLKYEEKLAAAEPLALSVGVERRLRRRDVVEVEEQAAAARHSTRVQALQALHSDEVEKFISRPGFGESRQPAYGPSYLPLVRLPRLPLPSCEIDPPAGELPVKLSATDSLAASQAVVLPSLDHLCRMNDLELESFLDPHRIGYFQDRDHVAGFGRHGFNYQVRLQRALAGPPPELTENWAVRRLELVSLLKHDTPRVYESTNLPNMEEFGEAPTRALNQFEAAAIPQLRGQEDLVAQATTNRIEMVGSIRASKQCQACHEVERGQLLGAFSYTLVRDPLLNPPQDSDADSPRSLAGE